MVFKRLTFLLRKQSAGKASVSIEFTVAFFKEIWKSSNEIATVYELRRALEKKTAKKYQFLSKTKHSEKSLVTCFLFLTGLSFHLRHLVNSEEVDSVEKKKVLVNKVKISMYGSSVLQLSFSTETSTSYIDKQTYRL